MAFTGVVFLDLRELRTLHQAVPYRSLKDLLQGQKACLREIFQDEFMARPGEAKKKDNLLARIVALIMASIVIDTTRLLASEYRLNAHAIFHATEDKDTDLPDRNCPRRVLQQILFWSGFTVGK